MFGEKKQTATEQQRTLKQVVRSLEENIITISGPALAISGVIAGIDVLTSNIIKANFPIVGDVLGVVWAICLMLTLDFQVLTLGVKASRVYRDTEKKALRKLAEILLVIIFACAISYVSMQMGTIFARSLGTNLSIEQAERSVGIDPTYLFYERSVMVMLLIFMSGWLRDVESTPDVALKASSATQQPLQGPTDIEKLIQAMADMQAQTLASIQQMNQQQMQVTIEQATRVSVEAVKESLQALPAPASQPLQLPSPDDALKAPPPPFLRDYKAEIEQLLLLNPVITLEEVQQQTGCTQPTAKKWLERLTKSA